MTGRGCQGLDVVLSDQLDPDSKLKLDGLDLGKVWYECGIKSVKHFHTLEGTWQGPSWQHKAMRRREMEESDRIELHAVAWLMVLPVTMSQRTLAASAIKSRILSAPNHGYHHIMPHKPTPGRLRSQEQYTLCLSLIVIALSRVLVAVGQSE